MYFQEYGVRGFVDASQDNLSTFAVDVDTGSYTLARSYLQDGYLPPEDAVRTEEFVNYFDYAYPNPPRNQGFGIYVDGAPSPFVDRDHVMMRVGVQGYRVPADERPDAQLTFVIDVSGSMDLENRLGLAKRALYLLVNELRPSDAVAIVVYGNDARLVLPMTQAAESQTILRAINQLTPEGATNAAAGIELAYAVAAEQLNPATINRVVLLSDGVANVGETGPDAILRLIEEQAATGITLTTIGLGMGNYNDVLMEQLANNGDGFYAYVDTLEEAQRVFVDDLTSTLLTIANDAKIQVEFNSAVVEQYRLAGYENRKVKDEDFRDDEVDAGEVGAGHSVTALYEVELTDDADSAAVMATVRLRWQEPATGEVIELAQAFTVGELASRFDDADPHFQLATVVAEYAEVLRRTEYGADTSLGELHAEIERVRSGLTEGANDDVAELAQLIWLTESLMPITSASLEE
jgi:Ca-activated chloride channel family protein